MMQILNSYHSLKKGSKRKENYFRMTHYKNTFQIINEMGGKYIFLSYLFFVLFSIL